MTFVKTLMEETVWRSKYECC